jgi:molybdopterin-guanine dinucleotide biosynthesis protein A
MPEGVSVAAGPWGTFSDASSAATRQTVRMHRSLGAILTGGAARRMGGSKVDRRLPTPVGPHAPTLLEAAWRLTRAVVDGPVVAIGRPPGIAADELPVAGTRIPVVADRRPGKGPLAGLETALGVAMEARHERVLLVPCDMPWLVAADLERLLRHPAPLVHGSPGGLPLACDATDTLREMVAGAIDADRLRLREFLRVAGARTLAVHPDAAIRHANINRPEDLAATPPRPPVR